ncbi:hypothetical protein VTN00DRAFT_4715 [Thermoascus crustaceus]|uniref:uncharacterized protein n=1 Tax=Thermoascus crustaceus TaxID=5088 RepID=UPI003742A850
MNVTQERVEKIRLFSERGREIEDEYSQQPISPTAIQDYNRKLDETLRELQDHVKRQEDALQKLRASRPIELPRPDMGSQERLSQVRRAKKAYDSLLRTDPELPAPDSPLPVLLALRETSRLLDESKASVSTIAEKLSADRQRLKVEEGNLRDAQMITGGLEERIERLRNERSEKEEKAPSQLANELIREQQSKNEELDRAAAELKDALDRFIDEHLASMLAAEDLGGPTVGDVLEVSDTILDAGYTLHGKPKKPKSTQTGRDPTQQRIDVLVQRQAGQGEDRNAPTNKREAAAAEMHTLLGRLLEAGSSYIDLPCDSAASRFLVKAKIAQFHPRDARRLRLIDFGRTIGD